MRTSASVIVAMVLVAVAGCGDGRGDDDAETVSERVELFALSESQVLAGVEVPIAIGTNVAVGLSEPDRDQYLAQFHTGAVVIDPIVPALTPSVSLFYEEFGRAGELCESWPLDEVYVNLGGALTSGSCDGFYRTMPDAEEFPRAPRLLRHLPISEGLATGLAHRYEVTSVAPHAVPFVVRIGFADSHGADVLAQIAQAEGFLDQLESAWEAGDPGGLAALYAAEATRRDGFAADRSGRGGIADWYGLVLDALPGVEMAIIEEFASGLGPGARYELTWETSDEERCSMRLAAVWDLDEDGLIVEEHTYYHPEDLYHPDDVLACGWAAQESVDEP